MVVDYLKGCENHPTPNTNKITKNGGLTLSNIGANKKHAK
jgi:hypothetical protein